MSAKPFAVPPTFMNVEACSEFKRWLGLVARADALATAMLSQGVFSVEDQSILDSAIEAIAVQVFDGKKIAAAVTAAEKQLHAGPLTDAQKKAVTSLSNAVFTEMAIAYGEAGYLLGLAVGQRADLRKMGGAR